MGRRSRAEDEQAIRQPILEKYEREGSPYYSTARLWDDGILDPAETRQALALGLSAALQRADPRATVRRLPHVGRRSDVRPHHHPPRRSTGGAERPSRHAQSSRRPKRLRRRSHRGADGAAPRMPRGIAALRAIVLVGRRAGILRRGRSRAGCRRRWPTRVRTTCATPKTSPGCSSSLDSLPVPLIGRVHGAALGGGVGLAAVCDIVVAADDAVFAFSEAKLGILPAVISPYVAREDRLVGRTRTVPDGRAVRRRPRARDWAGARGRSGGRPRCGRRRLPARDSDVGSDGDRRRQGADQGDCRAAGPRRSSA